MEPAVCEQEALPAAPVRQRDYDQPAWSQQRPRRREREEWLGDVLERMGKSDQLEAFRRPRLVCERALVDARAAPARSRGRRGGGIDSEGLPAERRVVREQLTATAADVKYTSRRPSRDGVGTAGIASSRGEHTEAVPGAFEQPSARGRGVAVEAFGVHRAVEVVELSATELRIGHAVAT